MIIIALEEKDKEKKEEKSEKTKPPFSCYPSCAGTERSILNSWPMHIIQVLPPGFMIRVLFSFLLSLTCLIQSFFLLNFS